VIEEKSSSENGVFAPHQPFSQVSPDLRKLNVGIHLLEQWYASDFKRRAAELQELLHEEILHKLRAQLTAEFDSRLEDMRIQYEERLSAQSAQSDKDRRLLLDEMEDLRKRVPGNDVVEEIVLTETAIAYAAQEISQESGGVLDATSLASLVRKQTQQLEMQGYLKGLKFGLQPTDSRLQRKHSPETVQIP
jgi:predicted nuclease with TOPRIM domain